MSEPRTLCQALGCGTGPDRRPAEPAQAGAASPLAPGPAAVDACRACPAASRSLLPVLLPVLLLLALVLAVAGVVVYRKARRPAWRR